MTVILKVVRLISAVELLSGCNRWGGIPCQSSALLAYSSARELQWRFLFGLSIGDRVLTIYFRQL